MKSSSPYDLVRLDSRISHHSSDARNSPLAPAAPAQVLSTRIEPAYPLQLSASRLMLELIEQPRSPRCVRRAHHRPCRRLLPRCPALAPAARSSSRRARPRRGAAQATPSAPARCGFAADLCSWSSPRLCSVLDRRGLPPERPCRTLGPCVPAGPVGRGLVRQTVVSSSEMVYKDGR